VVVAGMAVASHAAAQAISQVLFLPQTFFVGDVVEARVVVRSTDNLDLVVPAELPDTDWVDFRSIAVVQRADGYEVRMSFQPFFVGTRQLPPVDLGSMVVDGVSVVVSSMREEGDLELAPVRDQLLLPGTQILLAAIVVALVGIPASVMFTGGWLRRGFRRLRDRYRENRPFRTVQKRLKALENDMHELDGRQYYIRLLDILRSYLGTRFSAEIRSATTGELPLVLARAGVRDEEAARLVALYRFGDLVKFASQRVTVEDRERHLEEARNLALGLQRRGHREEENRRVGA
jgi:hypothetical protein